MKHRRKFAFIAHYVEPWNWLLNLSAFGFLHERPQWRFLLLPLYPLCWAMSVFYLFRRTPFRVVDAYRVNEALEGYTILITNFAWHFLFPSRYAKIQQRILEAVLYAQNVLKVDVVGLGALTKSETLTQGGVWITQQSGVIVPIVHGDTCTAWFVIERLESLMNGERAEKPVVVVGPTSKVGRAVMLYLARRGFRFKAYTHSPERLHEIRAELPEAVRDRLEHIDDLAEARDCEIWVTGKSKPDGKRLLDRIPAGATVINFAVPDPLDERVLRVRPDLIHTEGALVRTPRGCTMRFAMRLPRGQTYACTAGTMIHAFHGWPDSEVAEVDLDRLEQMREDTRVLGFTRHDL